MTHDLGEPLVCAEAAPPALPVFLRPELPEAALYGFPGHVVKTLTQDSEADPAAVLLCFFTLFGNAVGREPHVRFGNAYHSGRLFTLIVGDAATGRKGTVLELLEPLFVEADPDWVETRVMYGLQSAEAMIDRVADDHAGDRRLLVLEPEFSRLIETMSRVGTLSAQLRNAYDGRTLQRVVRDQRKFQEARHAHVSLLGMVTPEELARKHGQMSRAGGLESRFLFCFAARTRETSPFADGAGDGELAAGLRAALHASRTGVLDGTDPISRQLCAERGVLPPTEFPMAAAVHDGWLTEVRPRLPAVDHELGAYFDRAETHIVRLSLLYALASGDPKITMSHIQAAIGLWTFCARSAEMIFGVPVAQLPPRVDPNRRAAIVRYLYQRWPAWVPKGDLINQLFHGNVPAADIEAILADLAAKSVIERRKSDTGGRPREESRLLRA